MYFQRNTFKLLSQKSKTDSVVFVHKLNLTSLIIFFLKMTCKILFANDSIGHKVIFWVHFIIPSISQFQKVQRTFTAINYIHCWLQSALPLSYFRREYTTQNKSHEVHNQQTAALDSPGCVLRMNVEKKRINTLSAESVTLILITLATIFQKKATAQVWVYVSQCRF